MNKPNVRNSEERLKLRRRPKGEGSTAKWSRACGRRFKDARDRRKGPTHKPGTKLKGFYSPEKGEE